MLTKRLIACLDVRDGKLAKSVKFVDTKDIGDPVEKAREYYRDGLDELVFYDITASSDRRRILLDVVEAVAAEVFIPLSVGGGIRSVSDATDLRLAGAEKINVNSAAVQRPTLIAECAEAIGSQNLVLSMDIRRVDDDANMPSGYEIVIDGGRRPMGSMRFSGRLMARSSVLANWSSIRLTPTARATAMRSRSHACSQKPFGSR